MMGEYDLKEVLEKTAADIKTLALTVDTMCMGLERESVEQQVIASLKVIGMVLNYNQQNISNTLKTEQETG